VPDKSRLEVRLPLELIKGVQEDCARFRLTHRKFAQTAWGLRSTLHAIGIGIDQPFLIADELYTPPALPATAPRQWYPFYIGKISVELQEKILADSKSADESLDTYSAKSMGLLHDLIEFDAPNPLSVNTPSEKHSILLHELPQHKS
jgi:hypothetical protein